MLFTRVSLSTAISALAVAAPIAEKHKKRATGLQWFGASESGAEFGLGNVPGVLNKDYTWPVQSSIDALASKGMNIFRIPILMERITPSTMTSPLDTNYLADLTALINYITTTKGLHAIIDPHNYGRYAGNIITNTADFQTFWTTLAKPFAGNDKVIFDCNNEPHDMGAYSVVLGLMQACVNGVRAAGATEQYVLAEGTSYSGAWTWPQQNDALKSLTDPSNKLIYEMHQYLDSDGSGTSADCVDATIGRTRLEDATKWLRENRKQGILGEFAGGSNAVCESAVKDMLSFMVDNADVWTGALWWGAGPWWGNYIYSMEPESGTSYINMLPLMKPIVG